MENGHPNPSVYRPLFYYSLILVSYALRGCLICRAKHRAVPGDDQVYVRSTSVTDGCQRKHARLGVLSDATFSHLHELYGKKHKQTLTTISFEG